MKRFSCARSFVLLVFAFSSIASLAAQECTQAALALKPGSIVASKVAGSTRGITAADLVREKGVLATVHKMATAGYTPMGVVAKHDFHFDAGNPQPGMIKIADTFGYGLYLLRYNCDATTTDKSRFFVNVATPTILRIDANVVNQFRLSAADIADNSFRGYLLMRYKPQKINGFYFLGDEFSGNPDSKQKSYTWLITYDDSLPFTYLTRKEYLLLSKARLAKTMQENGNESGYYTEFVNRINEALSRPESELNQQALVNWSDEERFTGFVEEGSPWARYAVKHNPGYYRKGLAKSASQFFTVVFNVWEGDEVPVYVDNMNALKSAINFDVLRNLLGK